MKLLMLSDLLIGARPLPPQWGQRLHSLIVDLRVDGVWLLGNILAGEVGVPAIFSDHCLLDIFGPQGWLSRISHTYPIHWQPATHDRFVLDPDQAGNCSRYLPNITFHDMPVLLVPEGRPTRIVVMDGWQPRFWPNEKVTLRQRLAGVKPLAGRARTLVAYDAIRCKAKEYAEDGKKNIQNHPEAWAVVHGGNFPYWGTFDGFGAGCPGGREWTVLVDLDCRELSGLVKI